MDPWRPGTWGFEGVNPNPPTENPIQAEYDQWRSEYDAGVAEYNRMNHTMRLLTLGPIGVLRQQFNRWLRFFFCTGSSIYKEGGRSEQVLGAPRKYGCGRI